MRVSTALTKSFSWWAFMLLAGMTHPLHAQQDLSGVTVSLQVKDVPLSEVFHQISGQVDVSFSYNSRVVSADQKITYTATNKPLNQVLADILTPLELEYSFVEKQIIIKPAKKKKETPENLVTVSGFVTDEENGEALIGSTIVVKELGIGTAANAFGFYSLTIAPGEYTLVYSFIGFGTESRFLRVVTSMSESVALKEDTHMLEEVIVTSASTTVTEDPQPSRTTISPTVVAEKPALFGESDVIKSLEAVPGVKIHSDGSTFYYVRGGNKDQNLILMDDATIYNPSHLLGFFSTLIPDAINNITLYKGEAPASLGGRLSSVLDVRTRKGNDQHFQAWGSTGLISTKLGIEGPFRKDQSSFLLSGRVSQIKWVFARGNPNIQQFYFYDLTGKANFKLDDKNRIYFSFYSGADHYFGENSGIQWANHTATFRWNHLFSRKLFVNTTIAQSTYDYDLFPDIASNTHWNSGISNLTLKADFSYFSKPESEFTFGIALNGHNFNPGNLESSATIQAPVVSVRNAAETVLYGNHEWHINKQFELQYGLRLSSFNTIGESFEFIFDQQRNPIDTVYYSKGQKYSTYVRAEPRLSLSYHVGSVGNLKLGLSRNVQNIHQISNSISPFTSLEVWLPSSINIQPQSANEYSLGYAHTLPGTGMEFQVEGYFKKMYNQIDYDAHAETLLNPLIERELRFGTSTARGVEFMLRKREGRIRGMLSYTYSRVRNQFADINGGRPYNAFYDRPHQVNLVTEIDVSKRFHLGVNWNYYTGAPYSSPTSFYYFNGLEMPVYDQKNNARLPDYHRMDVSATWDLNKNQESAYRHSLTFSIYNFYGRKNILFVNYNKVQVDETTYRVPTNLLNPDRIPTQSYFLKFTPSVSYNFKWK